MQKKDYAVITIIALTLVLGYAVAYGTINVNSLIQAKPEPVKIPDYSEELSSLKSQVDSIDNSMSTLDSLKKDLTDIQEKITDIQNQNDQIQQIASTSEKFEMFIDKSSYFSTDKIRITAIGAKPQSLVQVRLLDEDGSTILYQQTLADSTGVIMYDLPLSNIVLVSGSYQIKLVSGQQTDSQPITIISSAQSTSRPATGSPYFFSARTDRLVYQTQDLIQILGTGTPNTSVTTVLTSPTGRTYTSNTTVQPDGTYSTFFTTQSYERGSWYATVANLGQSKIVYFTIGGTSILTAHTDSATYQTGDLIQVSGSGASPHTTINVVLTSPSGNTYSTSTTAFSDGNYVISYSTSRSFETGTWYANVTNLGQSRTVYFTIGSLSSGFTVHTDKMIYEQRDRIYVSGTGATPNTRINSILTSPSGDTFSESTTADADGTYSLSYSTSRSFETGTWYISATNLGQTRVVSIFLEPRD